MLFWDCGETPRCRPPSHPGVHRFFIPSLHIRCTYSLFIHYVVASWVIKTTVLVAWCLCLRKLYLLNIGHEMKEHWYWHFNMPKRSYKCFIKWVHSVYYNKTLTYKKRSHYHIFYQFISLKHFCFILLLLPVFHP